jgi:anti-sigma factor RsiW
MNLTCEQANELIGAYTDNDLPTEVKRRIETHLLGCAACAWEAQTLRIMRERLREGIGEVVGSDAFRARTLTAVRRDNAHLSSPEPDEVAVAAAATQYRLPISD